MDHRAFLEWLEGQPSRKVRAHVHTFVRENGLMPTHEEVRSLVSGLYRRLGRGDDHPNIEYTPTGPRSSEPRFDFAPSLGITAVDRAIDKNGYSLPETMTSLHGVQTIMANAPQRQKNAVGDLVDSFNKEIGIKDVKLENAEQLAIRDERERENLKAQLEESRRDKIFLQQMLTKGRGGPGGSVV